MSKLLHSFVSGGSNNLWDSVLPTSRSDARNLIVGDMCLHGHHNAKPFYKMDDEFFRDLLNIRSIELPTPTLKITISGQPKSDLEFQTGGNYHLIHRICVYNQIEKGKDFLGIYSLKLVYIPCTTNQTAEYLSLKDSSGKVIINNSGYGNIDGQFYYVELAEIEREHFIFVPVQQVINDLVDTVLKKPFAKAKTIKAIATVG